MQLPYTTMGSGSLAAMSVLEHGYRTDMALADGIALVRDAITAGIFNDMGSGGNVDITVISKDKTERKRPFDQPVGPRFFYFYFYFYSLFIIFPSK